MKIFIRADGGKNIGLGHIMRMIVLGKELRKNNEVVFICRNNKEYITGIEILKENKFKVLEIGNENYIKDIIEIQNECRFNILITDSYDVNEEYFNITKKYFYKTVYIDDVNKCEMDVDILVNQNINAEYIDYSKSVKKDTVLLLGPQYCMLREEFKKAAGEKKISHKAEDILLTVGGMDNNKNTLQILNIIGNIEAHIHVVIGKAFDKEFTRELELYRDEHSNITIYKNAVMSDLMKKCDIAVSACGSTIYELSAMKVPAVGIVLADNQIENAEYMLDKGMLYKVFDINNVDKKDFYETVKNLINDDEIRRKIIEKQHDAVNINGAEKLAHSIESAVGLLG